MRKGYKYDWILGKGSFHSVSRDTYWWIHEQPNVKEESITDRVIYQLNKDNPFVTCIAFSRNEEAKNGSDWEWWLVFSGIACRFRVQAKKMKKKGDNRPNIMYSNRRDFQYNLLINRAAKVGAFPLYALYMDCSHIVLPKRIRPFYSNTVFLNACENCQNGIFLISAEYLIKNYVDNKRASILSEEVVRDSYPVSLLDFSYSEDVTSFAINYPKVFFPLTGIRPHEEIALTELKESLEHVLRLNEQYVYFESDYPEHLKQLIKIHLRRQRVSKNPQKYSLLPSSYQNEIDRETTDYIEAFCSEFEKDDELCGIGIIDATDLETDMIEMINKLIALD